MREIIYGFFPYFSFILLCSDFILPFFIVFTILFPFSFYFYYFYTFFSQLFPFFFTFFFYLPLARKKYFSPQEKKSRVSDTDFKLRFDIKKEWKFDRLVQPYRGKDVNIKTGTHVETLKKELGK